MAGEFSVTTLGRLLSFANGRSSPDRADGLPYSVYGSNGVIGRADEANADANSIVIGRVGSYCGSLYLSKQRCWVTDNAIRATALDDNDPRFLFYLLSTLRLNNWRAGSGQPLLNQEILSRIPAVAPLPPTQRAIAHILGTLDDKIELNRRMNETLEAIARALFKSWFVDFDPVRAKAEGRDPRLPQPLADLFPDSLEESALGQIPRGWAIGQVADLCDAIYSGGTPSTQLAEYWNGDLPWLSSGETRDTFIIDTEKRITTAGVSNSSTRAARSLSTVIASAGQGNTRGQTSLLGIDCYVNQSVVVLSANRRRSSPLHLFFDLERRYEEFRQVSDGHSSRGSLTTKLLARLGAVLPPFPLIERFDAVVAPAVDRAIINLRESRALAALRDTLLPKLIAGELRVEDPARFSGSND